MVKGRSHQVIVIKAQKDSLFEEGIFILKDKAQFHHATAVEQAQKIATEFNQQHKGKSKEQRLNGFLWLSLGVCLSSFIWALCLAYITF